MINIQIFDKNIFTWFYFQEPLYVFIVYFFIGLSSLYFCPKKIRRIKYISDEGVINVGYYDSSNWSIIQPFIVPIALYLAILLYQSIPIAINNLIFSKVILSSNNSDSITEIISQSICSFDFYWLLIIFICSIILNYLDFIFFFKDKDEKLETKVKDWSVAFQSWSNIGISKRKNLLFDLFAYTLQWFTTFVVFVFIYKASRIIYFFVGVFRNKNSHITFKVDFLDNYQQFGFWGINPIIMYILLAFTLVLLYFSIIRYVHSTRLVKKSFLTRILYWIFAFIITSGFLSFIIVINKNLEEGRNHKIMELMIKKDKLYERFDDKTISEIELLRNIEMKKSLDNDIKTVLSQNIIRFDFKLYYLFIAIYIIQLRFIVFPPKSWLDALKKLLTDEI